MNYVDTSSLLKRYFAESDSNDLEAMINDPAIATSALTYVEAFSLFHRRLRERSLTQREYIVVANTFRRDWVDFVVIPVSTSIQKQAAELLGRHPLRASYAIQLASALLREEDLIFWSSDRKLTSAARAEALNVP